MSPDCHAMGTPTTQPAGSSAARGWAGGGLRRATHPCSDGDTTALSYVPLACAAATLASEIVLAYGPCATIASDFGSSERASGVVLSRDSLRRAAYLCFPVRELTHWFSCDCTVAQSSSETLAETEGEMVNRLHGGSSSSRNRHIVFNSCLRYAANVNGSAG
jgi:hypothetical protein